jgi:hypothetical protein
MLALAYAAHTERLVRSVDYQADVEQAAEKPRPVLRQAQHERIPSPVSLNSSVRPELVEGRPRSFSNLLSGHGAHQQVVAEARDTEDAKAAGVARRLDGKPADHRHAVAADELGCNEQQQPVDHTFA